MPKITKRFLDSLTPCSTKTFYWDDSLKGFGVCVTPASRRSPAGRKSYVLQFRVRGSIRSRRTVIGPVSVLTPYEARDRALEALATAASGADPVPSQVQKVALESEIFTLRVFATRYMTEHAKRTKKVSSCALDQDYLDRLILPVLGEYPLEKIAREDVAKLHQEIGSRTPYQANRVLALLSVMFTKAAEWGLLPLNHQKPTSTVTCFREHKRRRFLSTEELGRLGSVLHELETATTDWKHSRNIADRLDSIALIRLFVFTGCRKTELTKLRWDEVDRSQRVLRLIDSKTGPKNVELPSPALQILDGVAGRHNAADSPYVFPGRNPMVPRGEARKLWDLVRKKSKFDNVCLHDLRRTYASLAANSNVPPAVLQGLLGHAKYETTQGYVQLFDRTKATSAERVANLAAALLEGKPDADVVEESEEVGESSR